MWGDVFSFCYTFFHALHLLLRPRLYEAAGFLSDIPLASFQRGIDVRSSFFLLRLGYILWTGVEFDSFFIYFVCVSWDGKPHFFRKGLVYWDKILRRIMCEREEGG